MWNSTTDQPPKGSRIVAIYADGSGAHLFYFDGNEYTDEDGSARSDIDSFSMWAMVPDGMRLWCEECADDPIVFYTTQR